jgi:hypothetical protein
MLSSAQPRRGVLPPRHAVRVPGGWVEPAGAAISAFAKRPRCSSPSRAGSGCGCGLLFGVTGKHHDAAGRHLSQTGSRHGLQGTRPAAAAVHGISPEVEPSPPDSQMPTSNRSVSPPCSNRVSATSRTAVYGPVRTVVWEGRSREASPYPDPLPGGDVALVIFASIAALLPRGHAR